jgi:hypothetical protein
MDEEEKGFVIKDKRSLDEKGELRDKKAEDEKIKEEPKKEAPKEEPKAPPLPEVNFSALIFSLSSSVLLNFGEIADPHAKRKNRGQFD